MTIADYPTTGPYRPQAARAALFAEIGPYDTGYLQVGDGHRIYYELVGNPLGQPVLLLHGGPGAGAGTVHRRFFDPVHWRVVLFDQRGAGRSLPHGSLIANTTPALLHDIEALRCHLGIERWLLFGASWGSTLGLCYAQAHPNRVTGLVLSGIFLGRPEELDWFLHGLAGVFPEAHAAFMDLLPPGDRDDPLRAYLARLVDPDPRVHEPAARAWSTYESSCSTLLPMPDSVDRLARDPATVGQVRIEAHYLLNRLFLPPEGILPHMDRISHLRAEIVQGRYDMICPARTAYQLVQHWPAARLDIIPDAGHLALEPGIRDALIMAVESFRTP